MSCFIDRHFRVVLDPRALMVSAAFCAGLSAFSQKVAFVDNGQQIPGSGATFVALGDINGNGRLDAVMPTYVGPILVRLNQGDGTFIEGQTIAEGSLSGNAVLRDFNGSGHLDLFIINHSFQTTIYFGDGAGLFSPSGQNLGSVTSAHGLSVGDVNEDGHLDVFISSLDGNYNAPVFNDGSGGFTFGQGNGLPVAREVALGDLNGDGHLDVFLAHGNGSNPQNWPNRVLFGDGKGEFVDSGQLLGSRFSADVVLIDVNGDGHLDAIVANLSAFGSDPTNILWLNDGTGHFTESGVWMGAGDSGQVVAGDLDLDGHIDIIFASSQSPHEVYLGDGAGGFVFDGTLPINGFKLALGDLDGDGDLDIYLLVSGGARVLFNQTIAAADLTELAVTFGSIVDGSLASLEASDDVYLRTRSQFGFSAQEPNIFEMMLGAISGHESPATMSIFVESRINNPGGTATMKLRNWQSGAMETVHTYPLPQVDQVESTPDLDAADRVRPSDGRIELALRHSVIATFSAIGFDSFFDWIQIRSREF